jgi:hypothetical protein
MGHLEASFASVLAMTLDKGTMSGPLEPCFFESHGRGTRQIGLLCQVPYLDSRQSLRHHDTCCHDIFSLLSICMALDKIVKYNVRQRLYQIYSGRGSL